MKISIDWDIRFFRRYPKKTDVMLTIQGRNVPARTVDYSVIGVGLVIDDVTAPLTRGDAVSLDIDELDLHEEGTVAWVRESPSGLRVGVSKARPFSGSLALYPLSDILIGLQRTLKTGIFDIRYGAVNKKIYIRAGKVISAASNYEKDRLGDVLLKSRRINKRQYDKAAEIKKKSGGRYPAILVHMGYLKPRDLIGAAELQTRRIIGSLLAMKNAEFSFIEGQLPSRDAVTLNLSVADLIFRALKKNADAELLKNYLLDSIVDFSSNPLDLFQNIHFTPADRAVIACVDGRSTIGDIVGKAPSGRINPLKIIYALLEARFLKIRKKHESPSGIQAPDILGKGERSTSPTVDEIDRVYTAYKNLDYYRILDVEQRSTADEIKKAYYKAARKYRPDSHLPMSQDRKRKLIEIFDLITTACLTLTDPAKRKQYDTVIRGRGMPESAAAVPISSPSAVEEKNEQKVEVLQPAGTASLKNPSDIARLKFRDGKVAFWDKNYADAARLFGAAASFDDSVPEYHYYGGVSLGMIGKLREAVQALNRANDLTPGNADILAELGHVYLKLDLPVRAKGFLEKAAQLAPGNKRVKEGLELMRGKKAR